MVWGVIYHPEVQKDLDLLGAVAANRILDVIEAVSYTHLTLPTILLV